MHVVTKNADKDLFTALLNGIVLACICMATLAYAL